MHSTSCVSNNFRSLCRYSSTCTLTSKPILSLHYVDTDGVTVFRSCYTAIRWTLKMETENPSISVFRNDNFSSTVSHSYFTSQSSTLPMFLYDVSRPNLSLCLLCRGHVLGRRRIYILQQLQRQSTCFLF